MVDDLSKRVANLISRAKPRDIAIVKGNKYLINNKYATEEGISKLKSGRSLDLESPLAY